MPAGLDYTELVKRWNAALGELNAKLAPVVGPPGFDAEKIAREQGMIRVPSTKTAEYSTQSAYTDIVAGLIAVMLANNNRITEQLKANGIEL